MKRILSSLTTAALLVITGVALAQGVGKQDILGIQTGMTRKQAEAKLREIFPDLELTSIRTYKESPGMPASLSELRFKSRSTSVHLHFTPLSGKIFSIYRHELIGDRGKPETWTPFTTLQKAFDEKYGQVTYVNEKQSVHFIVYDQDGKPVSRKPCGNSQSPKGFKQTDDHCGVELAYKFLQGGNGQQYKGFADALGVTLTDYSLVNAEMKIIAAKAKEIKKQNLEQRNKKQAPKL